MAINVGVVVRSLRHYIDLLEVELEEERKGACRPYVMSGIQGELAAAREARIFASMPFPLVLFEREPHRESKNLTSSSN